MQLSYWTFRADLPLLFTISTISVIGLTAPACWGQAEDSRIDILPPSISPALNLPEARHSPQTIADQDLEKIPVETSLHEPLPSTVQPGSEIAIDRSQAKHPAIESAKQTMLTVADEEHPATDSPDIDSLDIDSPDVSLLDGSGLEVDPHSSSLRAADLLDPALSNSPVSQAAPFSSVTAENSVIAENSELPPAELEEEELEKPEDLTVPAGQGEIIREIQVRFVDRQGEPREGHTRDYIITRQFDLQPGDVYDPALALEGLKQVADLTAVSDASLTLEPTENPDEAIMVVDVVEAPTVAFIGGTQFARPWVIRGITLPTVVGASPTRLTGFQLPGSLQLNNIGGIDQSLTWGVLGGPEVGGTSLTFVNPWIGEASDQIGYAVNLSWLSYLDPTFNTGEEDVALPNGNEDFWEWRPGVGIQLMQQPTPELGWAAGLSYQVVSVRNSMFSDQLFSEDGDGNELTLSDDGTDTLLTANFALLLDQRNNLFFPTQGFRFQFGLDQAIPVGDASILYTRPMANFTQFLPLSFIKVDDTPSTLLFNLQAGTLLGDTPPYEAFVLGGSSSVRGYSTGEVASPQTFLQSSVEYRVPFASLRWGEGLFQDLLGKRTLLAGNLFFDYATGFGTQSFITGEPGVVREKPGDGFGFGLGLLATSSFGLMRLEFGISNQGGTALVFTIGDRF